MKRLIPLMLVLVFCLWTSLEAGQIYEWVDKNGVKHFTNEPPPPGAKIVNAEKAIPYNKAADQKRTREGQAALDQDLEQQESQTDQQAGGQQETPEVQTDDSDQQAGKQQETSGVQTDASESDDVSEGVSVYPYVRDRELVRQNERRKEELEDILPPPIRRNRPRERVR